ncbi:SKA complex subunit 1-like [Apostichopus japonicus]|uniref:SKA complex subunit 1-like n=1 Tax=Stichopus japonicus TaxID=307972 RepID=UPI003AB75EDF
MHCQTIQELEDHFGCKLESLATCMDLAAVALNPSTRGTECRDQLASINEDLCEMELILMSLRKCIKTKKEELSTAQKLNEDLDHLVKDLNHMMENVPHHLQVRKKDDQQECQERLPLQERHVQEDTYVLPQLPKLKKPASPRLDFIMRDEYTSIPKYMKGRISYEELNSMVEVINETIRKKYQLMSKPKNRLTDKKRKNYIKYKEQETKETKGAYFFVPEDLTKLCSLRNDGSVRSRLTMLRHCGRLREVRGGGLTRHLLVL